jgi:hypothetical protein
VDYQTYGIIMSDKGYAFTGVTEQATRKEAAKARKFALQAENVSRAATYKHGLLYKIEGKK